MSKSCTHAHHSHAHIAGPVAVVGAAVICITCGVHICADEIAAMMEILRVMATTPWATLPGLARAFFG